MKRLLRALAAMPALGLIVLVMLLAVVAPAAKAQTSLSAPAISWGNTPNLLPGPISVIVTDTVSGLPCVLNSTPTCILKITGSLSATVAGFHPAAYGTPISATVGGATGTLPAGAEVVAQDVGSFPAFCKLGASADSTGAYLAAGGGSYPFAISGETQLTCLGVGGTTTINTAGGSGLPTPSGGGGGGGGGGAVTNAGTFAVQNTAATPAGGNVIGKTSAVDSGGADATDTANHAIKVNVVAGGAGGGAVTQSGAWNVGGLTGVGQHNSITRIANTTAYTGGQIIGLFTSTTTVAPIQVTIAGANAASGTLGRVLLEATGASTACQFTIWWYKSAPTMTGLFDASAFVGPVAADIVSGAYLGSSDCSAMQATNDGTAQTFSECTSNLPQGWMQYQALSGQQYVDALISVKNACTPISGEVFTIVANSLQDK